MDLDILWRTVDNLIKEIRPIVQKSPEQKMDKVQFERILKQAQSQLPDNELIKEMDSGPWTNHIRAIPNSPNSGDTLLFC